MVELVWAAQGGIEQAGQWLQVWGLVVTIVAVPMGAAGWWLLKWFAKTVGDRIVESIGDALSRRWDDAIEKAHRPINDRLAYIEGELKTNGGDTVKDTVIMVRDRLNEMSRGLELQITGQWNKERSDDQ